METAYEIFISLNKRKLISCWDKERYFNFKYSHNENPLYEDYNLNYPLRLKYFDKKSKFKISILSDMYENIEVYNFCISKYNCEDFKIQYQNFDEALSLFKYRTGIKNPYIYTNIKDDLGIIESIIVKEKRKKYISILKK